MNKLPFLFLFSLGFLIACQDKEEEPMCQEVTTDAEANLNQFLGLWYEIATIPQPFTSGCVCTTAEYSIDPDGQGVTVTNTCRRDGANSVINGIARQPDPDDFTRLKVAFPFVPGEGDYWILEFEAGEHMLVGDPAKENLFVLSRTATMDAATYDALIQKAADMCFDTSLVLKTPQDNC